MPDILPRRIHSDGTVAATAPAPWSTSVFPLEAAAVSVPIRTAVIVPVHSIAAQAPATQPVRCCTRFHKNGYLLPIEEFVPIVPPRSDIPVLPNGRTYPQKYR